MMSLRYNKQLRKNIGFSGINLFNSYYFWRIIYFNTLIFFANHLILYLLLNLILINLYQKKFYDQSIESFIFSFA